MMLIFHTKDIKDYKDSKERKDCKGCSRRRGRARGFALLLAIIVSALLVTIGAILAMVAADEIRISSTVEGSVQAFYASESGTECAQYWSLRDSRYFTMDAGYGSILCNGITVALQSPSIHSTPESGTDEFKFNLGNSSLNSWPVTVDVERSLIAGGTSTSLSITSYGYNRDPEVTSRDLVQRVRSSLLAGACTSDTDLMLLLDSSASIYDNSDSGSKVQEAAINAVNQLNFDSGQTQVGIVTFADYFNTGNPFASHLDQTLTTDKDAVINTINSNYVTCSSKNPACPYNNKTNLESALNLATQELGSPRDKSTAPNVIIIITDGQPIGYTNDSGVDVDEPPPYEQSFLRSQTAVDAAKAAGDKVIVVGINIGLLGCPAYTPANGFPDGDAICSDWMKNNLASSPDLFYPVTYADIVETLGSITQCSGNILDE